MIAILQIVIILIGLFLLLKGADWFVDGTLGISDKWKVSGLVIGMTIVAMGTSIPEAAVSLMGVYQKRDAIAVGNILGSNIVNILLILGICGSMKEMLVTKSTVFFELPFLIAVTAGGAFLSMNDGVLELHDGLFFLAGFLIYLAYVIYQGRRSEASFAEELESKKKESSLSKSIVLVFVGSLVLFAASEMVVSAADVLARSLELSNRLIALTVLAISTSLPELFTSVTAVRKGNSELVIGNIIGSNIFNILFVLGSSTFIHPVKVEREFMADALVAVVAGLVVWLVVLPKKRLGYYASVTLLLGYVVYVICRSAG